MRKHRFLLITMLVLGASCAARHIPQLPNHPKDDASMTFWIGNSDTQRMIEGVTVQLIADDGRIETVGSSSIFGSVEVSRDSLQHATVILFCHENFFCGAYRTGSPRFFEHSERLIQLAPMAFM